jgi:cysteine desulfurase
MTLPALNKREPESIYLDHAAATPLLPEVAEAMDAVRDTGFANPSSPHTAGRRARRLLEEARERIVELVGGDLGQAASLVFTGGATEANRLGVLGTAAARGRIITSARDHSSLAAAARELAARGWEVVEPPLRADGTLAADLIAARTDGTQETVCLTLVCGQTGSREDVAGLAARRGGTAGTTLVHVDATQALAADAEQPFGLPPGFASTLALAPHKVGGPRGIGGLLIRRGVAVVPLAPGSQEGGLRGGTEAVVLAVGFARAVEVAVAGRAARARRLAALRDHLEARLLAAAESVGIAARVVGRGGTRAPHIATVAFTGLDRQAMVMAADLEGVCCATGTACASGSSEPSPALVAMRLPEAELRGAVRFSLGAETTMDDVDGAVERMARVCARMTAGRGR